MSQGKTTFYAVCEAWAKAAYPEGKRFDVEDFLAAVHEHLLPDDGDVDPFYQRLVSLTETKSDAPEYPEGLDCDPAEWTPPLPNPFAEIAELDCKLRDATKRAAALVAQSLVDGGVIARNLDQIKRETREKRAAKLAWLDAKRARLLVRSRDE